MHFSALSDVSRVAWLERSADEAKAIKSKSWERDMGEILDKCLFGQAPEQWLIEKHSFTNNPEPYQDLIAPNGEAVEIKTTSSLAWVDYVIGRLEEQVNDSWRTRAPYVIIFIGHRDLLDYFPEGIYKWNGNKLEKINENKALLSQEDLINSFSK